MALLDLDGQDHFNTAYFPGKYTVVDSTNLAWTVAADAPDASNCLVRTNTASGNGGYVGVSPLMTQSGAWSPTVSGVCGFKVYVNDLSKLTTPGGAGDSTNALIQIMSGGNTHLALQLNPTGTFSLVRAGFGGTTIATSAEGLRSGEWATVEMKWVINDTTGSCSVVVNRVAVLTVSGVATKNGGIVDTTWNTINFLRCTAAASGATTLVMRMADKYIADLSGGANDIKDFLLSWNFATIVPSGAGSSTGWTPLAGNNWDNVEEIPPDGDTTYNATTALTTRDMYAMQNVPANAVILGYQTVMLARLTAAGVAGIKPSVRIGGVNYDANEFGLTQTTYVAFKKQPYDTSPATGVKATEAEINAAEFGIIKSA